LCLRDEECELAVDNDIFHHVRVSMCQNSVKYEQVKKEEVDKRYLVEDVRKVA
jgi:hypothetical protein